MENLSLIKKVALAVGGIALFGCVISAIRLVERSGHASKVGEATAEPQSMTLAQLITRGVEGNAHVKLSELSYEPKYLSRTSKSKATGNENIQHVWLVARVPGEAPGGPVRALVKTTKVSTPKDVDAFMMKGSVQGLIINKIDRPSDDELRLLRGAYPEFDADRVILVEADRQPPGQLANFNLIFSLIAGGIALLCLLVLVWDMLPGMGARPTKRKKKRRRLVEEDDDD